jgi:hypothetical protein
VQGTTSGKQPEADFSSCPGTTSDEILSDFSTPILGCHFHRSGGKEGLAGDAVRSRAANIIVAEKSFLSPTVCLKFRVKFYTINRKIESRLCR